MAFVESNNQMGSVKCMGTTIKEQCGHYKVLKSVCVCIHKEFPVCLMDCPCPSRAFAEVTSN